MHDRPSLECIQLTPLECVSLSMNTQPSVPAFITHANLKCEKYIHLCDEICLVSFESWELILQFVSSGSTKIDETIGYCWCQIVRRWSLWLQQWSLWLHHCDVIHSDKQSVVTMAVDLKPVRFCHLTFNLCVSHTLHAHPLNHWYAQGRVW